MYHSLSSMLKNLLLTFISMYLFTINAWFTFYVNKIKTGNIHDNYLLNDIFNTILIKWFHFLSFDIHIVNAYEQFNSVVACYHMEFHNIFDFNCRYTTNYMWFGYILLCAAQCLLDRNNLNKCDESYDVDLKRKRFVYYFFFRIWIMCALRNHMLCYYECNK